MVGLIQGKLSYEMKGATSDAKWIGGVITPDVWHPVLAWFKSVNDGMHSECQVRLYYNAQTKKWAAWAYPQEARTGMSAREIDNPAAATQREQFKGSEGWLYSGTIHHHCSSGAFQSGTDLANEKNQDGLHITIGLLNRDQYELHARFYLGGNEFSPALSAFWDIGEIKNQLPADSYETVARYQMTKPAPPGTEWPIVWNENLIDTTVRLVGFQNGAGQNVAGASDTAGAGIGSGTVRPGSGLILSPDGYHNGQPTNKRRELALALLWREVKEKGWTTDDVDGLMAIMKSDPAFAVISRCARQYNLHVDDIVQEWAWEVDMKSNLDNSENGNAWETYIGL